MSVDSHDPLVSVLLPVHRVADEASARRCLGSLSRQSLERFEILLVANGCDGSTRRLLSDLARGEPRARVLELPEANLAAALNAGLGRSRSDLIARMDIDDWSHPGRLDEQRAYLEGHPDVALVACGWERVGTSGERETCAPPTDPRDMRWRLLLDNPIAHGSVMFRRDMVREVGGYDEACMRAQDHDLWLRLAEKYPLAALPGILYEYHSRHAGGREESAALQALTSSRSMVRSWSRLPMADEGVREEVSAAIASIVGGARDHEETRDEIDRLLREHGPSAPALIGRLWVEWATRSATPRIDAFCRLARAREVTTLMKHRGAPCVHLWGAGRHTRWLLGHRSNLAVAVAGIVDDTVFGSSRHGFVVGRPEDLARGTWVLISSDGHEEKIWRSSEAARRRGVEVWRIYGRNPGEE